MNKTLTFLISLFLVIVLAACSGGGAGVSTQASQAQETSGSTTQVEAAPTVAAADSAGDALEENSPTHEDGTDYTWDSTAAVQVALNSDSISAAGHGVTVNGTTLSGEWRNGCLKVGDKAVAIGVSLESCAMEPDYETQTAELPD